MTRLLRAATRGSELALWQTGHVAELVRRAHPDVDVEPLVVETRGDRVLDRPIWELGGKGVFVKEVQAAVLDGRADLAVHSAKDLPAVTVEGLVLAAVPVRADPRDALVGVGLDALPPGATVATGSVRRRVQLADRRTDLTFTSLRGNIATRLAKVGTGGIAAVVVAAAALERLGRLDEATEILDPVDVVPQVGQGALAVECRADDDEVRRLLGAIEDPVARWAVDGERGFLAELGGDCDLPAGAHATASGDGTGGHLDGMLASLDGHVVLRARRPVPAPGSGDRPGGGSPADGAGRELARHLLDTAGGRSLLAADRR